MNSESMAVKEVKNGRLAMVAFFGFAIQAVVVADGPLGCLAKHTANPVGSQIFVNILHPGVSA